MSLSKGVCSNDDCGKLKSKDSCHTRRSKQNTYHVVNKNIASSKVTDRRRLKRGCLPGHPQAQALGILEYYLGVPWASPSFCSCHSLFHSPSNPYPKLENFTTQNFNRKSRELRQYKKINHHFWYCCELIIYLYLCNIYCIPTFLWFIPPDTSHRCIKISKQHAKNRICQKQNRLQQFVTFKYFCKPKHSTKIGSPR